MTRISSTILPVLLGSLTLVAGLVRQQPKFSPRVNNILGPRADAGVCGTQPKATAPHPNIWSGLTNQELADALKFLYNSKELNLTKDGGNWDNTLVFIDLLQPNKSDVLPFLTGAGPAPPRYAAATLMFGSQQEPYLEDYYVGPLPLSNSTKAQPLNFLTTRKTNSKVPVPNADTAAYGNFTQKIMSDAADIFKKLWNLEPDALRLWDGSGPETDNGRVKQWSSFASNPGPNSIHDTWTVLPLGLYLKMDITGRDPAKWKIDAWLYDNVMYESTEAFRAAVMQPGFKSLGVNAEGLWAQLEKQGDTPPLDESPPPAQVQSGPKRFSVDTEAQYVTWMDFSFYVGVSLATGMKLYDVKYKGKRILYEIGMEDALAHYAGNDPVQSSTCFSDIGGSGFGSSIVTAVNGYDCPAYSTYLNTTLMDGTTRKVQPNGICLFETDSGYPIQRHTWAGHTSVSKNIAFTVRSVSTIGNYDYMTSFEFRMDGSILIGVRASGYIMTAFAAHNDDYGFRIHDNLSGSMHDHVLTFKADFDIMGEKNSFQKVEFAPASETYVWSEGKTRSTMKRTMSFVESEDASQLNWSENGNSMYAIVNRDAKNQFGESPGYRFMPAAQIARFTIQNSSVTQKGARQADHHFAVSRQKDTEARASHPSNLVNPDTPVVDFDKFFDGDSLNQEDLVLWFNLGMHHMPHTGDLPNTVFSTAYSGLIIEPFNYLPGDPSRASTQQIRIDQPVGGNNRSVVTFGASPASCPVDMGQLNPKVDGPLGLVAIQKLPYDGTRPNYVG